MRAGPAEGGDGVVDRGRERMFRREPVIDREDVHVGVAAEAPAQAVMGVEIAHDEAAAVIVDQQRPRAVPVGA